jgi:hypothetical protein
MLFASGQFFRIHVAATFQSTFGSTVRRGYARSDSPFDYAQGRLRRLPLHERLVGEILLGEPGAQCLLDLRRNFHEADSDVAAIVGPGDFHLRIHRVGGAGKRERNTRGFVGIEAVIDVNLQSTLAQIDQLSRGFLLAEALQRNRHIDPSAMVAQAAVKNHIAGGGERVHGLFYRDGLVKRKHCAAVFHIAMALRATHDYERDSADARNFALQLAKKLAGTVEVAIDNESVDFGFGEPGKSPLRIVLDGNIHVKAAENAFENADFLPVTRNNHRRECHAFTVLTAVIGT